MNISAMTPDEVRDKLAELRDWVWIDPPDSAHLGHWLHPVYGRSWDHPIPNTLDEAAKLPEGWYYWINHCSVDKGGGFRETFICEAVRKKIAGRFDRINAEGPTELEARFRLRLACELAEKEAP